MIKKIAKNILSYGIEKARCHHIKLFYLSLYCMLFAGCGKAIKGLEEEQEITRDPFTASFIPLKDVYSPLSGKSSPNARYDFTSDSLVRIPASIEVEEGNAGNNVAVIYFNAKSESEFEFFCKYIGGASSSTPMTQTEITNGLFYHFDNCYSDTAELQPLNYHPGRQEIQYGNKSVILDVLSADPRYNTHVATEFEVEWH